MYPLTVKRSICRLVTATKTNAIQFATVSIQTRCALLRRERRISTWMCAFAFWAAARPRNIIATNS
jgi:hypothetical protein